LEGSPTEPHHVATAIDRKDDHTPGNDISKISFNRRD